MKNHRISPIRFTQSEVRMSPLERLAESYALVRGDSNAERIRLLREVYFADVDALLKSGRLKIPK